MGQTDLAVRFLAEKHLADILSAVLVDRRVQVLGVERSELKLLERFTDNIVRALVDGVESIIHLEFQTQHEEILPDRMLAYHGLLRHRHHLPVLSLVVYLMHKPPPHGIPTGIEEARLRFSYEVFCPWQQSITVEDVRRHPGVAPIATLTAGIDERDLPAIGRAIEEAVPEAARGDLLALTYIVAGRRFPSDLLQFCLRSKAMEDSVTYQQILAEGEAKGLADGEAKGEARGEARGLAKGETATMRQAILDLLDARLGHVPEDVRGRLETMDAGALRELFNRLVRARGKTRLQALLPR